MSQPCLWITKEAWVEERNYMDDLISMPPINTSTWHLALFSRWDVCTDWLAKWRLVYKTLRNRLHGISAAAPVDGKLKSRCNVDISTRCANQALMKMVLVIYSLDQLRDSEPMSRSIYITWR